VLTGGSADEGRDRVELDPLPQPAIGQASRGLRMPPRSGAGPYRGRP
jgi:hypothetical protein